jgi:hypothetical protein
MGVLEKELAPEPVETAATRIFHRSEEVGRRRMLERPPTEVGSKRIVERRGPQNLLAE